MNLPTPTKSLSQYHRIPTAYPDGPDGAVKVKVISGISHGVESPVRPLGGCWYFHIIFKNGGTMFQQIREYCIMSFKYLITCSFGLDNKPPRGRLSYTVGPVFTEASSYSRIFKS